MDNKERNYIAGALDTIHHVVRCSEIEIEPTRTRDALEAILKLKKKVTEM